MGASPEVIIVLGGGVGPNGELPLHVEKRLEHARELYEKYPASVILLSGYGRDNPPIAEAEAMKKHLLECEVPDEGVLLEPRSTITLENAYYSREIIDEKRIRSLCVVTNAFHMHRSKGIFEWVFGEEYTLGYSSVSDQGINPEELENRAKLEEVLDSFYRGTLFPAAASGDMEEIGKVLFDSNHPVAKAHAEFQSNLTFEFTLY